MSTNRQLAEQFSRMASVLELLGANRFRVVAYERGARALEELSRDVAELAEDPDELTAIDGIGKGLAEKIIEFVKTGRIDEIERELEKVPEGVLALLDIPGLGPKTAAMLWRKAGITSIDDLKAELDSGELEDLPRMGAKTIQNIQRSIAFAETAGQRIKLGTAMDVARRIVAEMKKHKAVVRADFAGSLRRGRETIGDVDILVACENPRKDGKAIGEHFRSMDMVRDVIAAGATKSSVRTDQGLQADLRVIAADRYGAALMYFTGSKQHNVAMRERAIRMKMRLNEYGLWKAGQNPDDADARPIVADSEPAIYKKLKLDFIAPELREDRGEIQAAEKHELPRLIELKDIRAELHAHTVASDGVWSIEELAEEARDRGFHTVAVTDHSQSQTVANGLSPKRMEKHLEAIREAAERAEGITILAGVEVDILADGSLDYPDELLAELDLVVASPHVALKQDRDKATRRLLRAIENPYVHILGHPTGRLIGRREGLSPDIDKLIRAAAETRTVLELNANHWRLDLRDTHARAAVEAGVRIAINCDSHGPAHMDQLPYGILTARRAWVEKKHVVNCLSAAKLKQWLKEKRKKMGAA